MSIFTDLAPMPPDMGPPLPAVLGIYWPWYKPAQIVAADYTCPYDGKTFSTADYGTAEAAILALNTCEPAKYNRQARTKASSNIPATSAAASLNRRRQC